MQPQNRQELELELIMLRHRRGDLQALPELVASFERPLFYFLRRIVRDESQAWDVMQKTWMRIISSPPQTGNGRSLKVWLYRVARNTALNHIRDEHRHDAAELQGEVDPVEDPESFDAADAEEIHAALDRLSRCDREVLTLHFLEQLSTRELSDVLDIPQGTVKWRLHVAKRNLRTQLEQS